jgi:hypothetical protein
VPNAPACDGLLMVSMQSSLDGLLSSISPTTPSGIILSSRKLPDDLQLFHTPSLVHWIDSLYLLFYTIMCDSCLSGYKHREAKTWRIRQNLSQSFLRRRLYWLKHIILGNHSKCIGRNLPQAWGAF